MAARRHWRYYLSVLVVHLLIECSAIIFRTFPRKSLRHTHILGYIGMSRDATYSESCEFFCGVDTDASHLERLVVRPRKERDMRHRNGKRNIEHGIYFSIKSRQIRQ